MKVFWYYFLIINFSLPQMVFGKNLVINSSFEISRNKNVPYGWYRVIPRHCPEKRILNKWFMLWKIDSSTSYHKEKSLCITRPYNTSLDWWDLGAWQRIHVSSNVSLGKSLILSVYLKANKPLFKAKLFIRYPLIEKTVIVDTKWKRFFFKIPLTKEAKKIIKQSKERICIGPISYGKLWIDAVQLETSELPTEYKDKLEFFTKIKRNYTFYPELYSQNKVLTKKHHYNISFIPIVGHISHYWLCESYLEMFKKQGFNSLCIEIYPFAMKWGRIPYSLLYKCNQILDKLLKNNMFAIIWIHLGLNYAITKKGVNPLIAFSQYKKITLNIIKTFKFHPAILAWYIFDEPGPGKCKLWKISKYQMYGFINSLYREAKKIDSTRPIFINFAQILRPDYGSNASDIASIDFYCKTKEDVSRYFYIAKNLVAASYGRPCWMWIHMKVADRPIIELKPDEFVSAVYQSLIAGVRGFMYFTGLPDSEELWQVIGKINKEIKLLSPVVLLNKTVNSVYLVKGKKQIRFETFIFNNHYYLIAVNSKPKKVTAYFNLKKVIKKHNSVSVLFETRDIYLKNGILIDVFKPFERHIYFF